MKLEMEIKGRLQLAGPCLCCRHKRIGVAKKQGVDYGSLQLKEIRETENN
jgi:hypothetical protein